MTRPKIKDEDLLDDLKKVCDETEGYTSVKTYSEKGEYSGNTIINRFDSWENAKEKAGVEKEIEIKKRQPVEKEKVVEDIQNVKDEIGGEYLSLKKYKNKGKYSYDAILKLFGSWSNAKEYADVDDFDFMPSGGRTGNSDDVDREMVLNDILDVVDKLDKENLTIRDYNEHGKYGEHFVKKFFSTWNNAKEILGLEKNSWRNQDYRDYSREEIKEELRRCDRELDNGVTVEKYSEIGRIPINQIWDKFDGFKQAKIEAGVDNTAESDRELIEGMLRDNMTLEEISDETGYSKPVVQKIRMTCDEDREEVFKEWVELLKDKHGWFNSSELSDFVNERSDTVKKMTIKRYSPKEFVEWCEENSDLDIRFNETSANSRVFISNFENSLDEFRELIPDDYSDFFDMAVGSGFSPSVVAGGVLYFEFGRKFGGGLTQREVCDEVGVADASIRNFIDRFRDELEEAG